MSLADLLLLSQMLLSLYKNKQNVCIYAGNFHTQLYNAFLNSLRDRGTSFNPSKRFDGFEKAVILEGFTLRLMKLCKMM